MKVVRKPTRRFGERVVTVALAAAALSGCGTTIGRAPATSIGLQTYPSRSATATTSPAAASSPAAGATSGEAGRPASGTDLPASAARAGQPLCEFLGVHEDELGQFPTTAADARRKITLWEEAAAKAPRSLRPAFTVLTAAVHSIASGKAPAADAAHIEQESRSVIQWFSTHCTVQ